MIEGETKIFKVKWQMLFRMSLIINFWFEVSELLEETDLHKIDLNKLCKIFLCLNYRENFSKQNVHHLDFRISFIVSLSLKETIVALPM